MGFGNQLKYLLYRNFLLKKRNYKQTLYEAISVLYFIAILATVRKFAVKPKTYKPMTDAEMATYLLYQSKSAPISNGSTFFAKAPRKVGYVFMPGSSQVASQRVIDKLLNVTADYGTTFQNYFSESALENAHKSDSVNLTLGLVLKIDTAKTIVDYTIKVPYKSVPLTTAAKKIVKDDKCRDPKQLFTSFGCPVNLYYSSTYATFQSLVDGALIEVLANTTGFLPPKTTIKMFPKAEYQTDLQYLKTIVSIYMVMAFSPYIMYLLTHIVTEKEKKIKEAMKIMGLSTFVFWLSWFITYAIVITVGVICTTVIAKVSSLFGDSDYFIIFIIFFLYGLSLETFAFVLTPLFKVGRTAGGAGSFAALLLSLLSLLHVYLNTSNAVKWVTGLLSPVALSLALMPTLDTNAGTTWSNVGTKGDFPTSNGIILLFVDTVLYLLLAMYLDTIFPGEYGQRKHPLFFLKPSFWRGMSSKTKRAPSFFRGQSVREDEPQADVEEVPEVMQDRLAISIRRLEKVFKRGKEELKALDGVSLDVYEGQITALLGQNGAGKSTLIAALTGMLSASSGSAFVYGHSIRISEDMDKIREMIGLCPQQNIIFEELTPREHLKIFAGIKGIPDNQIDGMVEKTLKEIDLFDKGDSISKNLSGGQKRKLCVGIALIGDPKVIFLDEPTSGMDPSSRRYIWSLLQSKKEDRVIFLTTHFMDEADILADYKAVMAKGKLRCAGSSLFLKSRFGVGYYISMVTEDHCDREKITHLVTANVSGAEMSRVHGKELSYRLPLKSVDQFPALFAALENENDTDEPCSAPGIGVASYGVSMTTLEEVFLKLDDSNEIGNGGTDNEAIDRSLENLVLNDGKYTTTDNIQVNVPEMNCAPRGGRLALLWSQMIALIQIKALIILRSPMAVIFQIVIPPIFTIVGLVLMRNTSAVSAASVVKNLALPPSMYLQQNGVSLKGNTEGLFQNKTNVVIGDILNGATAEKLKYSLVNSVANAKRPHDIGFEFNKYDSVNGQADYQLRYNDSSIYSIPVGLNTISNIMLRVALQKQGKPYNGRSNPIAASSKPFESLSIPWTYDSDVFNSVLLFSLTFAIMPLGFAIVVVRYRQDGIRHQLRVSGVSRWVYWLHFFIADLTLYIFPVMLILILIPAFDIKALNNANALGSLFLLLLLYNPTSLVFSYLYSFAFTNWHTMQNILGSVQIIFTIGPFAAVSVVDMVSGGIDKSNTAHILHLIFLVIDPMYSLAGGLYYIARVWRMESLKAQDNNVKIPASKYFELSLENGFPSTLICLTIQLFLFSYLVAVLDQWKAGGVKMFPFSLCGGKRNGVHHPTRVDSSTTDERKINDDVKQEISKVRRLCDQSLQSERAVIVEGLRKEFGTKRVVDDLYMDVEHNEIFGLLGPNGAGKTTAMNVMTADFVPTAGEVYLSGHSIKTDLAKAFYSLGYCPQADTIWETITLKEHLKCFAVIKGIPRSRSADAVRHYMDALRIGEHADTKAKELSGGTKRKLCFLISMCGSPNVVLMDEPSTGMDPSSKRFLWNVISANITGERGAILTTHSMEEADALCSRVGILVKGQLKCIGTTQQLKSNYGGGYSLEVKAMINDTVPIEERMVDIEAFVHEMFPNAIETERFGQRFVYKIPKDDVGKLSDIFAKFEDGKRKLGIEEYSFSQATLEQVFLEFAREQDDDLADKDEEVAQSKRGSVPA